jgi:hypothetical protein
MMSDPVITCPSCKTEIKLNESLAAPLLEATRAEYEQKLRAKETEFASRDVALKTRESALTKAQESIDSQVAEKLRLETPKIADAESKKAKFAFGEELEKNKKALADVEAIVKEKDVKLGEAQKAQADFLQKSRVLDDATRELELTVEKRIQGGLGEVREQAKKEAEDGLKFKVAEAEQTISAMQKQIEDLKRKAEQGSQQLQGDVQEVELRSLLTAAFPMDSIEPVAKGEFGGDVIQRVNGPLGQPAGTILWESKRTKGWVDAWLPKLRDDQRAAKADLAVIVSQTLPKGVDSFTQIDGVWVTSPKVAIPLATTMRSMLMEIALARAVSDGQGTKMEMIYEYLTGPRFRHRVTAIVEAFTSLREDLDKERKAIMKQWAKREEQLTRVMTATVGMYGDLQGIAGKSFVEIEGLEFGSLEALPLASVVMPQEVIIP